MKLMKNKLLIFFVTFVLSFVCILSVVCPINVGADSSDNSADVVKDLQKDSTFSVQDYPIMDLEYFTEINSDKDETNNHETIEVIQIAESDSGKLIIYTYQPLNEYLFLKATAISLSNEYSVNGQDIDPSIYNLTLLSRYGVFCKYLVENFNISNEIYRYYNLVTIYREFTTKLDKLSSGSEEDGYEVGVGVGQQWSVCYKNNSLIYEKATFETLEIKVTFSGSIRLMQGNKWHSGFLSENIDAWFICFYVPDYVITKIYDAKLSYRYRDVTLRNTFNPTPQEGDWSELEEVKLNELDKVEYNDGGTIKEKKYSWNRISSAGNFLTSLQSQNVNLSDELKSKLSVTEDSITGYKNWVFSFLETKYTNMTNTEYWQEVDKVTVLSIHFLDITGKEYNLGVVSDRVNPDEIPDGIGNPDDCTDLNLKLILGVLFVVLLLGLLNSFGILPLIGKAVVFVISAPFVFIKWLIEKFRR